MSNLIHWRKSLPVSSSRDPLGSLQNELDRVFNSFYNSFESSQQAFAGFESLALNPSIDIVDDKNCFKIEAEMPGISEDNIKVSIDDGILTIKAEKKKSSKNEGKHYLMREISYGSYERNIALPESVDVSKAKASFKKGMLWVSIPKKAEASEKHRDIKVEKAAA